MTKKEWLNLRTKSEVTYKTWRLIDDKSVDIILEGAVVRMNSNHSQALVKWNNDSFENWYGRLGLEINKTE